MSEPQTRWWWNCRYRCGASGSEGSSARRDESQATHEMVCPKNPNQGR